MYVFPMEISEFTTLVVYILILWCMIIITMNRQEKYRSGYVKHAVQLFRIRWCIIIGWLSSNVSVIEE